MLIQTTWYGYYRVLERVNNVVHLMIIKASQSRSLSLKRTIWYKDMTVPPLYLWNQSFRFYLFIRRHDCYLRFWSEKKERLENKRNVIFYKSIGFFTPRLNLIPPCRLVDSFISHIFNITFRVAHQTQLQHSLQRSCLLSFFLISFPATDKRLYFVLNTEKSFD